MTSMTTRSLPLLFALALAPALAPNPAAAQEPQAIAAYKDWSAFAYSDDQGRTCFIASQPKDSRGNYTQRGDVWALVTHRSPGRERDRLSILAGYRYLEGAPVTVTIDDKTFTLFTENETAWASSNEDERALVAAMKAGVEMVVKGQSWRPTPTTDRFSLLGFTAAYEAIGTACPD